jgi:hypothetical protein
MTSSIKVGVSGAWKDVPSVSIGVGGAWKSVANAWIGVGGAWKKFYTSLGSQILAQNISALHQTTSPSDATAVVSFTSAGAAAATGVATPDWTWLLTGSAGDYEIFVTGTGDTPTGSALDTWLALSSNRTWTLTETAVGTKSFSGTYKLRRASDSVETDAKTFAITATADT